MHTEAIRALAQVLTETGLTEIRYEHQGVRIRLSKTYPMVSSGTLLVPDSSGAGQVLGKEGTGPEPLPSPKGSPISSMMVGTVYLAPKPEADPFVKVGDRVQEGQVLLIIEAMKVFNPIKSPFAGVVTHIAVGNGTPVEYGTDLMYIQTS